MKRIDYQVKGVITSWDEALAIGNGKIGSLIYGETDLRIAVDRMDLWDDRTPPEVLEKGFTYKNMVKCAKDNWAEHNRLFDDSYSHPYPTKLTAGAIIIKGIVDGYAVFKLDSACALATVIAKKGEFKFFVSKKSDCVVAKIPKGCNFEIVLPKYFHKSEKERGLGYKNAEFVAEHGFTYYIQETTKGVKFGIIVFKKEYDGYDELYYTVYSGDGELADCKNRLRQTATQGFESLLVSHKRYWSRYYSASSVTLPDKEFQRIYNLGKYYFASTSQKGGYPMPLQGVWTADNDALPPWKGDYHADLNMQISYEHYQKAGNFDEGSALCEYLWKMRGVYRKFAKSFYGVEGYMVPAVGTIKGVPLGGWPMYALYPANTIWLSKIFDEHYRYTGDETFFKNKAYPFLQGVAKAVKGLLIEVDGYLRFPLTSSPEMHDATPKSYLDSQSNFEIGLLRYLYRTMIEFAEKVGDDATEYKQIYAKLSPYAVNKDGSFRICATEDLTSTHRHFSHLLSITPLHEFSPMADKTQIRVNIDKLVELGTGYWTGFSFVEMADLCAYAGEGNMAYHFLYCFVDGICSPNGFHLNGDYKDYGYNCYKYRPFTLEANMSYLKAVQNMLLRTDGGSIEVFPAVTDRWQDASFKNLRAQGNIKISGVRKGGKTQSFTIKTEKQTAIKLVNNFGTPTLTLIVDGVKKEFTGDENGIITLSFAKEIKYQI